MKTVYKLILPVILLCCVGAQKDCAPEQPDTVMTVEKLNETRFTVKRVGVFYDDLAYGGKRGIYLIVDENTKREHVGISGIGISDLGLHTNSENDTVRDER